MADLRSRDARAPRLAEALARRRVPLGFVAAIAAVVLARPTWASWQWGALVALAGEAVRVWAAGHLEKSREVTRSGPYRWARHPLYVGSSVIALGIVIASRSTAVGLLTLLYMTATLTAAVNTEEAFLRRTFGQEYDWDRPPAAEPTSRRFSFARATRNREYRAVLGLLAGFAILALKVMLSI